MADNEEDVAKPSPNLFIGSLAWEATDEDLQKAFAECGEVIEAKVIRFSDTGRSKGFGFVEFADQESADKAMKEMNGKELAGRPIKVDYAKPREDREKE